MRQLMHVWQHVWGHLHPLKAISLHFVFSQPLPCLRTLRNPVVSAFLDLVSLVFSLQGGSRSSQSEQFRAYLACEVQHWFTLLDEFVVGCPSWERAGAGMARYHAQRLAWDQTITRLLRSMVEVGVHHA